MKGPDPIASAPTEGAPNSPSEQVAPFCKMTSYGHAAVAAGDIERAARCFEAARREAEAVFGAALEAGGPAVLVGPLILSVAYRNASAAKRARGDEEGVLGDLSYAADRLIRAAASAEASIGMRLNCVRHLRHAMIELVGTSRQPDAEGLSRVAAVADEVVRAAEFRLNDGSQEGGATCH